jgi:hypothetical protein
LHCLLHRHHLHHGVLLHHHVLLPVTLHPATWVEAVLTKEVESQATTAHDLGPENAADVHDTIKRF